MSCTAATKELLSGFPTTGYRIYRLGCTERGVAIALSGADGDMMVRLHPPTGFDTGERLGTSKSFSIWLVKGRSPGIEAVAHTIATTVAANDDGSFYSKVQTQTFLGPAIPTNGSPGSPSVEARRLGRLDNFRRLLTWMAFLAILVGLVRSRISSLRSREDWLWVGGLALLAAVAVALRLTLPTWAPLHANGHGVGELRRILSGDPHGPGAAYGVAEAQFFRTVIGLWGGAVDSVFVIDAVLGGLCVIPLGLLTAALLRSRPAGFVAALALALHPAHILLSLSESPFVLGGALFLAALAAAIAVRDDSPDSKRLAWLTALALSLCVELCVPTIFLTAVAVGTVILWRLGRVLKSLRPFVLPSLVLALAGGLHLYAMLPVLRPATDERKSMVFTWGPWRALAMGYQNILFDRSLTAWVLLPLAGLGLLLLLYRRRIVEALAILLAVVLPMAPALAVLDCRADRVRYQPLAHFELFLLAAVLVTAIPLRWGPRAPRVVTALLAGLFVIASYPGLKSARIPDIESTAFVLAREAISKLPQEASVRVGPGRFGVITNEFPEYFAELQHHRLLLLDATSPAQSACFVWLGPSCYAFTGEEIDNGVPNSGVHFGDGLVRPECAPLVAQIAPAAKPVDVLAAVIPRRDQERFVIPTQHPLIGMFPCRGGPSPNDSREASTGGPSP